MRTTRTPASSPSRQVTTMMKTLFSTIALAVIATLPRDSDFVSPESPTRLVPPAVFAHSSPTLLAPCQLRPSTQKILTTTTTASAMATAPAPAAANMSCPTDIHPNYKCNCDKTPFIAADVNPALEFVQANLPVSEVKQQHHRRRLLSQHQQHWIADHLHLMRICQNDLQTNQEGAIGPTSQPIR